MTTNNDLAAEIEKALKATLKIKACLEADLRPDYELDGERVEMSKTLDALTRQLALLAKLRAEELAATSDIAEFETRGIVW